MEEVLLAENISKSFPGVQAVHQVSQHLYRGEIMALVGENGAGKSTLSQILCYAQKPDSGRILVEGREASLSSA